MAIDVLLMLDEFVLHLLLQIIFFNIHLRQTVNHILHKMKPVSPAWKHDDPEAASQRIGKGRLPTNNRLTGVFKVRGLVACE